MFRYVSRVASLLLVVMMVLGCKGKVPVDHTSLSLDTGQDPGKPSKTLTMNWMHHSTGKDLLEGGLLAALKANNIKFHDMYYKEGTVDGYVIGDHTDPQDFHKAFGSPKYFDVIRKWELEGGKQHDIVMFKSCFPASDIKDQAMLDKYKEYYRLLFPSFKKHKDILFIGMSTPPLMKGKTTPDNAKRAREWAKWVTTEYATDIPNVQIFDLFAAMAILEGKPDQNTLAPQFGADKYDSHPTKEAAKAVTRLFIPWLNRALRESGKVKD